MRLTPELLQKLRSDPREVLLRLNVAGPDGVSRTRDASKKTSLLTLKQDEEDEQEQYELLSFAEDPGTNHVCSFRRQSEGYSVHKTGAIHQKLLVQRLLDDTEKDRIKDKHAKSVLASKARASKLLDAKPEAPAKRQRLLTRTTRTPTMTKTTGSSAWSMATGRKRKLVLPSALSKEAAQEAKERIEKGFEVGSEESTAPAAIVEKSTHSEESTEDEEAPGVFVSEATAAAAKEVDLHDLFSSDSDDPERTVSRAKRRRLLKGETKENNAETAGSTGAANAMANESKKPDDTDENRQVPDTVQPATELDTTAQAKERTIECSAAKKAPAESTTQSTPTATTERSDKANDVQKLPPVKPSGGEVKRARVRSTLVPDRVTGSQLSHLSFFPPVVVQICQRLAKHRGRSVILDDSDYDSFAETYEQFRRDWEVLDKAYSIEMIKTEGLHLQLEFASSDSSRREIESRIQASTTKKEGLTFVRDAMTSIQKILRSIQTSIRNFDMKHI